MIENPAEFGRVAVLMGGVSAEREISLISGQAVLAALQRRGVDAVEVDVQGSALPQLQSQAFDRVFNVLHGRGGEDGVLQALLHALDLPYTGSGVLASALSMDKLRSKLCWRGSGIPTPDWCVLKDEADLLHCVKQLGFPVIVKPALEGSSIGMSKAADLPQLRAAWQLASGFACDVFAEAWVQGSEYTVGFVHDRVLPSIRLQTPHDFYDYEAKYRAETTRYHCPSGLPVQQETALQRLATDAYLALGVSGWGRVDLMLNAEGEPQLIEVNTVPGMTDHSLVPMAAQAVGMNFEQLVWAILETSFDCQPDA